MRAEHHIQTQRIVLAADTLTASGAGKWHQRLERLQETTLLPALEQQLDQLCPPGETIVLERVEVVLPVAVVEKLESEVPGAFGAELRQALRRAVAAAPIRTPALRLLVDYLRSGRFGWQAGDVRAFSRRLTEEATGWDREEWDGFFLVMAENFRLFFGRLTQVQGGFQRQALAQLRQLAVIPKTEGAAREKPEEQDQEAWQRLLPLAGYPTSIPNDPPGIVALKADEWRNTRPGEIPEPTTGYFPPNAGLVILHPYLGYLARETGCQYGDTLDQNRMAALLHYAVSDNEPFLEWEHSLTKVLLGLTPDTPLLPVDLTEADRRAVDDLLNGIIAHWSILKNTSRDGLRGGFLRRPGKLYAIAGGWQLLVESRGHDLLLAHLPWSINLVKSPWMAEMLQVNWS